MMDARGAVYSNPLTRVVVIKKQSSKWRCKTQPLSGGLASWNGCKSSFDLVILVLSPRPQKRSFLRAAQLSRCCSYPIQRDSVSSSPVFLLVHIRNIRGRIMTNGLLGVKEELVGERLSVPPPHYPYLSHSLQQRTSQLLLSIHS